MQLCSHLITTRV